MTNYSLTNAEADTIMAALLHAPSPLRKQIWEKMDKVLTEAERRQARNAAPDCPGGTPIRKGGAKYSAVCSLCGWRDLQHYGKTMRAHKAPASWKAGLTYQPVGV